MPEPARRLKCGLPAAAPCRPTSQISLRSSSAPVISTPEPRIALYRRCSCWRRACPRSAVGDRDGRSRARAPDLAALRRIDRRDLVWHRASRPARSVRACVHAPRTLGRMDADCQPAGCLRAAICWIRARLEDDRRHARPQHRLRDDHARCGHLVDRRCDPRRTAPSGRAL